jgi:hypothetical protein
MKRRPIVVGSTVVHKNTGQTGIVKALRSNPQYAITHCQVTWAETHLTTWVRVTELRLNRDKNSED